MFAHLHAYINVKYILQLDNVIIANDPENIRPIQQGCKRDITVRDQYFDLKS